MSKKITFAMNKIQSILKNFEEKTSSFASVLVTTDGLPVTSAAHSYINEFEASAIAASILALGELTVDTFQHNKLHRVLIEGEGGTTILTGVDENYILITIAPPESKLGLLFMEISSAIKKIKKAVKTA